MQSSPKTKTRSSKGQYATISFRWQELLPKGIKVTESQFYTDVFPPEMLSDVAHLLATTSKLYSVPPEASLAEIQAGLEGSPKEIRALISQGQGIVKEARRLTDKGQEERQWQSWWQIVWGSPEKDEQLGTSLTIPWNSKFGTLAEADELKNFTKVSVVGGYAIARHCAWFAYGFRKH